MSINSVAAGPMPELTSKEPRNPSDLFNELVKTIKNHIILDDYQAVVVALWIASTYVPDATGVAPILVINAPERACGKSVLLGLVEVLVHKPLSTSNMTQASMFRLLNDRQPTLLLDEADTFLYGKTELHGMLNSGYSKQNPFVYRVEVVKDKLTPCRYNVYGPKALAGIAMDRVLPDPTISRSFVIEMRRKLPGESVERVRPGKMAEKFSGLKADLQRFKKDYSEQVMVEFDDLPVELSDRMQDNWAPLFAIARCGGQEWIDRAKVASISLAKAGSDGQSLSNSLLTDIREILQHHDSATITTADLLWALTGDSSYGWGIYNQGKALSARQLARFLANYKIKPRTVRQSATSTPKGYWVCDFKDAFERYLAPVEVADASLEPSVSKLADEGDNSFVSSGF